MKQMFKPLAVALAVTLSSALSWFASARVASAPKPSVARVEACGVAAPALHDAVVLAGASVDEPDRVYPPVPTY